MKKYTRYGMVTLTIIAASIPAVSAAEDILEIYQLARNSDPQLAAAEAQKNSVAEGITQARAALLPQISASISYGQSFSDNASATPVRDQNGNFTLSPTMSSNDSANRNYRGTVNQSIYDHSNYTRLKASRAAAARGESDYETASQALMLRVATDYFAVLNAEDVLVFTQANEKALARQLEQAEQRFEVGLSAITDVHDAHARHDTAVAAVIQAQNTLDDTREALIEVTGKQVGNLKRLRDKLPLDKPQPSDPQAWVEIALNTNPTITSRQHVLEAAEYTIDTQRAGYYPTLSASLSRTIQPAWSDQNSSFTGSKDFHSNSWGADTSIGIVLNVPLFSGGITSSRVRQAIFDRDAAQDQLEQQRRAIVRQTRNAFRAVIAGISEVQARQQSVISAKSALEATQAGFEVGTRTIVDVLISQQNLFQAQSDYSKARHTFVVNNLQLKQSAGTIAIKDLEAVNGLLE